jgi:proteasome accessory factor C
MLVTLRLEPTARWVAEYYPVEETRDERGGGLTVRLRVGDPAWLTRLMLRLGGSAEIVDPAALADDVRQAALDALANYS